MKKSILRSAIAIAISSLFATTSAFSAEQPNAEDLVGKAYGGIHLLHIDTDSERWLTNSPLSSLNNGDGFGAELGYRLNTTTELRLGYSHINLDAKNGGFAKPNSSNIAFDVLYFPTEQNFYFVAGLSELDIVKSKLSSNLGLGYRHYLSEKTALYFETKAHYQFDEYYDDFSAQLGFTYFFGESKKSRPAKKETKPAQVMPAKAVAMLDSDKDGVADAKDQCKNTPMVNKVDDRGCTIYMDDVASINLLINFDNNNAVIKPQYFEKIKEVAEFLKTYESVNVVIEGHASAPGNDALNKTLSQLRANAVVDILTNKYGIDADRLSAVGYGEERLLNKATTRAANAENRRIVATMSVDKKVALKR
ncbi:OmpA family protein [Colwellia sp. UCD-KL20]|uniref:OmpA family protein n=1 Tax=Colwellia sp. UCD-KL20 TaxID=1917165 RepID=UPI0009706CC6|nr:OmpA family protein [Colwellia sp. UCD-KL20]